MNITDKSEDIHIAIKREDEKAAARRALAERRWDKRDLMEIFGFGLAHRLCMNPRDAHIGKNYFSSHFHAGARNPAGSKLLRGFIRANGPRSGSYERDYKALTGRRYNHLNLGEDDAEKAA
jgi:hypothetical protein